MRYRWFAAAMLMAVLLPAALTSTGPAHADLTAATRAADGYGVLLGSADAPAQLEIFCEPQCPICKNFEGASGDQLLGALGSRRLAVTYRWLTFLDDRRHNDTSARVGNALMLAADPATHPVVYQAFVNNVYRNQDPHGDGTTLDDVATMARESGVPAPVVDRIAAGETAVDTAAMNTANQNRLTQLNPEHPSTPTVYNLRTNQLVDTDEAGWLDRLMQG